MDEPAVDNAICDGPNDRGVDALVVDDDLREITIFQCKYHERADRAEGNSGLERLVGAVANFESPEAVDALLAAGPNPELQRLIRRNDVRTKVADGAHVAQAIFITNGVFDANARAYAQGMAAGGITLGLWDAPRLAALAERTRRPDLRAETVRLACASTPILISLDPTVDIALALVPASELIQLPGIDDRTLFARNVRLGIGGTRVNRELVDAVREPQEHAFFPA